MLRALPPVRHFLFHSNFRHVRALRFASAFLQDRSGPSVSHVIVIGRIRSRREGLLPLPSLHAGKRTAHQRIAVSVTISISWQSLIRHVRGSVGRMVISAALVFPSVACCMSADSSVVMVVDWGGAFQSSARPNITYNHRQSALSILSHVIHPTCVCQSISIISHSFKAG